MTESQSQTPPPPPPPPTHQPTEPKKGISTLGWIAIGCIGLLLIGALLTFACTAIVAKKAKNFVDEASDNPAMSAAEMVVRLNPNLDVVDKDEEAGTLTIYDKTKDKTVTLDLDQIMEGKFGLETGEGEEMNFEFGQKEDGTFGATVTDETGEVSEISIGKDGVRVGQDAENLPSWLPTYKGAELSSPFSVNKDGKVSGTAMFSTPDAVTTVADAVSDDLEGRGFEVERSVYEAAGLTSINLTCKGPNGESLTASINSTGNGTTATMTFSSAP